MTKSNSQPILAVFDFDNTITNRDSLLPLLIYQVGILKACWKLIRLSPYFVGFGLRLTSRQTVKEAIIRTFFKNMSIQQLEELGRLYAQQELDRYVKPEALQRIKWHQQQGHICLLVSASLDFYLKPWAEKYAFQDVIASRLELNENNQVTGYLQGINCWGKEKVRRLIEKVGSLEQYIIYMYGDSQGDEDLLALAHYPFYRTFE